MPLFRRKDKQPAVAKAHVFRLVHEVLEPVLYPDPQRLCALPGYEPERKKIIANVMNLKVDIIESDEGPGLGGAILAAVGCGEYASVKEAADKLVKIIDTVEPDPELAAKYEARYAQFKEIYPTCKPLFEILTK